MRLILALSFYYAMLQWICCMVAKSEAHTAQVNNVSLIVKDSTDIQSLDVAKIIKVYDGDTFYANLYNLPDIFGKNIGIRLVGIDTPEINSSDSCCRALAKSAKMFLEQKLETACRIELKNVTRDKYFRIDATIYADNININELMIQKGYAKPYFGEGPKPTYVCQK